MAKKKIATATVDTIDNTFNWTKALEGFIFWKKAQRVSERTLADCRWHVSRFFKQFPTARTPEGVKPAVLEYMSADVKPATYNLRLVNLKAFFDWCIEEGLFVLPNPLKGFKRRKDEGRVVNIDIKALTKLLEIPDKTTFTGLRDYAMVLLTLDTGIRPKEALSLLVDDINLRSLEVRVRADIAKTRVTRTLPISPLTATTIRKLIQARHPEWKDTVPVFCSCEGNQMETTAWGDRLEIYCKELGVKIRPYDLRHAFALNFLRNGGHAMALQRTLGHTDLTMTKRYISLTQDDLREQHSMASPLNSIAPQKHKVRKLK